MQRSIPLVLIILFLTCPLASPASYRIQLKNGGEFKTVRYWEEGDQILFYVYGGVAGVQKDSVKYIKKADVAYNEKTFGESNPIENTKPPSIRAQAEVQTGPITVENQKEHDEFLKGFSLLKERFKNLESMKTSELYEFRDDLNNFKRISLAKGLSHIYDKQLIEVYSMDDAVKAILKGRLQ